jgi:hypothetical protein
VEKGVLQPAAPGLLSLLQLKQRGRNPDTLGDVVTPVIDLTEWYHVIDREYLTWSREFDGGAGGADFGIPFTDGDTDQVVVPIDEVWFVWNLSVICGPSIGSQIQGMLATASRLQSVAWTSPVYHAVSAPIDITGGSITAVEQVIAGGDVRRWFKGGTVFGAGMTYISAAAAGSVSFDGTVEFTRLKV